MKKCPHCNNDVNDEAIKCKHCKAMINEPLIAQQKIIGTTRGANDPKIQKLLSEGWRIKTTNAHTQGYDAGKTCCFGCLFLPLALLGRKPDVIEYILEKD